MVLSVYIITCSVNAKRYVGFTHLSTDERFKGHVSDSSSGSCFALHSAIRKYGVENFTCETHSCYATRALAAEAEINLIVELSTHVSGGRGYNMTCGGEGVVGLCAESLARMGQAHKKENLKQSTLDKMSVAKRGKKLSDVTKMRMSVAHMGKIFSNEHRQKIGAANGGINCKQETREKFSKAKSKPVQQLTMSGELLATFPSMKEAQKLTGVHWTNISRCCLGSARTARGFVWRYVSQM